jgi:excisionase family DNA binding protein
MTHVPLTISPQDVVGVPSEKPSWLLRLEQFVREAAASGETVTVTSRVRMMTPDEMAARLGVSRSTISRKIKVGEIAAVKVGNRNRIPYAEFERYWSTVMRNMAAMVADDIEAELFGNG